MVPTSKLAQIDKELEQAVRDAVLGPVSTEASLKVSRLIDERVKLMRPNTGRVK